MRHPLGCAYPHTPNAVACSTSRVAVSSTNAATPMLRGIVHGRHVTCPLHGWNIALFDGEAVAPDKGATGTFAVKVEDGGVYVQLKAAVIS